MEAKDKAVGAIETERYLNVISGFENMQVRLSKRLGEGYTVKHNGDDAVSIPDKKFLGLGQVVSLSFALGADAQSIHEAATKPAVDRRVETAFIEAGFKHK